MAKRSTGDLLMWSAIIVGGGYLIYRLLNNPNTASGAPVIGGPGSAMQPAPPAIQASLNTALTNIATGITDFTA